VALFTARARHLPLNSGIIIGAGVGFRPCPLSCSHGAAREMIEALEGKSLWGASRAVDMEMFSFGERVTQEHRGKVRTIGELALHLQSTWRITRDGRVLVGYRDLWSPRSGVAVEDFDPDKPHSSKRDELLEMFVGHGEEAHRVEHATMSEHSDLTLTFADGCVLDVLSDLGDEEVVGDEVPGECWRLFSPGVEDDPHMVVRAGGVVYS
jgi:hypothetical protein